jgi:hypothetical protein
MRAGRNFVSLTIPEFLGKESVPPPCSQVDPELFFPQEIELPNGSIRAKYTNLSLSKQICSSCPLKNPCLEYALVNSELGIWGGTTEEQRRSLKTKLKIVRNRKTPSPRVW